MIRKNNLIFFIVSFFLIIEVFLASPLKSQQNSSSTPYGEAIEEFKAFVREQMIIDKSPAITVGFLKDDYQWVEGFGFSDLENMVCAKSETAYRLASITKTITATAILQLVEKGKINLENEVQVYVPYFPRKRWPIKISQLLGHLGGISHYRNYDLEGHIKEHKDTREAIAIFQDFDLVAEPGTKYHYSSYGYNLLGAVIESVSGKSYGEYITLNIFLPLGMTNSRMDDPTDLIPNRARGYRLIRGEIKNSEYVDVSSRFAGGGTRSTVPDLLKFAKGIIEGKLLSKESLRLMFTSMVQRNGYLTGYGMGWMVSPWRGHFQVFHGGSQPETKTHLLIFPLEKFAIAIASNLEGVDLAPYFTRLAELILEEDFDSHPYLPTREERAIYHACNQVFSFGMSAYEWDKTKFQTEEKELRDAISYFNKYVSMEALTKDFREAKKKIEAGIHPISNMAFTRIGFHMASLLERVYGNEIFKNYHQKGPISFFHDYLSLQTKIPEIKDKFNSHFSDLISNWNENWQKTYNDSIRKLRIGLDTDFKEIRALLSSTFKNTEIYPDLTEEIARIGRFYLEQGEREKALELFKFCSEIYPNSPQALVNLGQAYLWLGNSEEARTLYKKACMLDPDHHSLSLDAFFSLGRRLENAGKIREIFLMAEIAAEVYPKNAELHKQIADMYLRVGDKNKALEYYKKALALDPRLKEAKEKIEAIKKELKSKDEEER